MSKASKKVANNLVNNLGSSIGTVFLDFLDNELIDAYLDAYAEELTSIVTDKNSLANPDYFFDDYKYVIENFEYVEEVASGLVITLPTEDTFNFDGRLGFIELLIHDLPGKYLELSQEDYDILINSNDLDKKVKSVVRRLPAFFDSSTPKELRFYLLHTRGTLYKTIESILGKKLVVFPFSNSSAINLFDEGIELFEANIESIFETATTDTNKKVRI